MSDPSLIRTSLADDGEEFQKTHPWVRNYEEGVPTRITTPDHPLTWLLDTAASSFPGRSALIYYGARLSYAQLSNQANQFAIGLQQLGVQKGDRVAIALPNIPQYPIAFYGALRAGAIVVPTNPLYTEREMQHQLADSGAKVLIMLDSFYPIVRAVRKNTALKHIIITSPADFLPSILHVLYPLSQRHNKVPQPALTDKELREDPMLHNIRSILKNHGEIKRFNLPIESASDDLAVLQYTGGTTGLSKAAMLTHRNLLANTLQNSQWVPRIQKGKETTLCVAPFFHSYGLTVCMNVSIYTAATMILLPRFSAKDTLDAIRRHHPTLFPGIPTMYIAIMREAGQRSDYLQSIQYCISGAAPLPAKVQQDFEAMTHGKLVEGYGLSEASPVTHANPLTDKCRNGSIGLPISGVEAAIRKPETGELLPVGEVGEIVVKGPNIMRGYWQREEETRQTFVDGWMRTGDIGKMDGEGYFYVVDRAKDMIVASGFNVYPREVEEVLFTHPAIAEAAVVGIPHEYRGETVAAFIVLKPGFTASEELRSEIITFCKAQLAAYKVPKVLEFREALPKSLIGKVLKRELRAQQA
ncbi:MAG TPA: long-chain fatty acid--CoA ligase [Ktedonobacteraceae bacterium]|jgi:long-chain acyl-CoA synthetase|nr:long-chain fatty acid--CoA ligase [Ktedonobacteraceae bacterium]